MPKKKSHEQYVKEVFELVGNEYSVLGQYINSKSNIHFKHNICGHEWTPSADSFLSGRRCPTCFGNQKRTTEQYVKEVFELVGNEYSVLGQYINSKSSIRLKHNICGHEWDPPAGGFITGRRCPNCFGTHLRTTEEFKEEVYSLVQNEYLVIGEYKGANHPITMKHALCGNEWNPLPSAFLNSNTRCPYCSGTMKLTTEEFKKRLYALHGNDYTVVGDYVNNNTRIDILHHVCGQIWQTPPSSVLSGHRCNHCFGTPKKSHEEFVKEVYDLVGDEYVVLGQYQRRNNRIEMFHTKCGNKIYPQPGNFLAGHFCTYCFGTALKTTEEFKTEVRRLFGVEFEVIGEYMGSGTTIEMIHNKCGNVINPWPNDILSNRSTCKFCKAVNTGNIKRKKLDTFKQQVQAAVGDEYEVLGEYKNNKTKILMKHNECNRPFKMPPSAFLLGGNRCPHCNESKGERKVANILDKLSIAYTREYRFLDCKDKKPLPFDFSLFDINHKLFSLIEYDGILHFKQTNYHGGIVKLRQTQKRDAIKNQYCLENNIPLLRIPFTEFNNIDEIIKDWLEGLQVLK